MTDRRRTPRYTLEQPLTGDAMPMQDVMVEEFSDDRLVVVSFDTHAVDEEMLVYLTMPHGVERYRAKVTSSTPVSINGKLRCRLEMCVTPEDDAPAGKKAWTH